jgi:translocation and assembly module TamB
VLRCDPLDLPVNEGRVKLAPWVDLTAASPVLRIDQGTVIDNIRISPELCTQWLKYIAPLVADATRAEGRFSLSLDGAAVPLNATHQADVHGHLSVHTAQVGPGPLAQQFLTLAQQVRGLVGGGTGGSDVATAPWLTFAQQDVKFDVVDGRVHHQGLTMNVQDMMVRTSGSVGLDQSLDLTAEIPIRDEWVANRQILGSLRGQVLKIPVRGTFAQPRLDAQAIRDIGRQTLRDTAGKMLENQLQRGLERFLPPRP